MSKTAAASGLHTTMTTVTGRGHKFSEDVGNRPQKMTLVVTRFSLSGSLGLFHVTTSTFNCVSLNVLKSKKLRGQSVKVS